MPVYKGRKPSYLELLPIAVDVEVDGVEKGLIAFQDKHGFILTKEKLIEARNELIEVIKKADEFYAMEGIEESIRKENIKTSISIYSSMSFDVDFTQNENGKFMIPNANLQIKQFRSDLKRNWSFKCGWCGQKVSSKTDKSYYSIDFPHIHSLEHDTFERSCSKECGQHIWNEVLRNWIFNNKYQDMFELD